MSRFLVGVSLLALVTAVGAWTAPPAAPAGRLVVVKMVDVSQTEFRFEPAAVTVGSGDTVRFEQTGAMPHNVEFREVPGATNLGEARMGPYLVQAGQTYDVVIDGRFGQGTHNYVCTPHEALGMTGTITVGK